MKIVQIAAVPAKVEEDKVITVLYALDDEGHIWAMYPYPTGWTQVELPKNG